MGPLGPLGRRAVQRDAAHRANSATHPEGRVAPPKAAIFCPPAALRAACGGWHHRAARALQADKIFAVQSIIISVESH